ncbi:MAG: hypothetical protein M9933_12580 [Chitinophagaceae bacterium]|nr:hypothetical protein [Chitinophagaceae bacterium]
MKTIYIILFFVDILFMIFLSFLFLKLMDTNAGEGKLFETFSGIVISIGLLFFLLYRYSRLPAGKKPKEF